MKIDHLNVYKIQLPFSGDFSHSLRKGYSAKNIIIEIIADQGKIVGYGEGAPRPYVTGETPESAVSAITGLTGNHSFPWELNDADQIWNLIDNLPDEKSNNSSICALETALLDALAKQQKRYIMEYFPPAFLTDTINYGAVISFGSRDRIMEIWQLINKLNLKKLRIKMGKNINKNKDTIETVKALFGDDCDLRIDVNGAWNYQIALAHIPFIKKHKIKVVEQPMENSDKSIIKFAKEMKKSGVVLMADELACSMKDVNEIIREKYYGMINIRLSKCGGFRRSLKIIEKIRASGLSFQIGCQLGESGILSAAGRILGLLCRDAVYYDGSYDKFLLAENTTLEDVSFGPGGKAGPLEGPGLGVKVSSQKLEKLSNSEVITINNPN